MASTSGKTMSTRTGNKSNKLSPTSVDSLAQQLTSNLVISNTKGKGKAVNISPEQARIESMRAVNSASQALSAAIQSGWKKSAGKASLQASGAAAAAAKHLKVLRQDEIRDVDVERAAVSVLGKLITLEMYDEALDALDALHPRICALLQMKAPHSSSRNHLLWIPISPLAKAIELTVLTLTVTYLVHSITVLINVKLDVVSLDSLANALSRGEQSFLSWIPQCSALPAKQFDSLLARTYTALTKGCMSFKSNFGAIFCLRMYAVRCLALTSAGTVEPSTFWDQVVRFAGALVKSQGVEEEDALRLVLAEFAELVRVIEEQNVVPLLTGKGFVGFCEYWLVFAKKRIIKAGDICLVNRIAGLIQGIPMASSSSSKVSQDAVPSHDSEKATASKGSLEHETLVSARLCATLVQTTSAIDQNSPDMVPQVQDALSTLKASADIMRLLQYSHDRDPDYTRISGKVDRALERARRATISAIDSRPSHSIDDSLHLLLETISGILLQQCSLQHADADIYTRSLDTLFVLSRIRLNPSDPRSYIPAHDLLTKAASVVEPRIADPSINGPNYLRCISGAFHNLAGVLYQAGRYGSAVGFLQYACSLGARALEVQKERGTSIEGQGDKTEEGWRQLEEQLYRRWELLGVCFLKNGDRKQALEAFQHCIKTFPYTISGFSENAEQNTYSTIFALSSSTKQLASILDRVTNLSACDLLLEPSSVSVGSLKLNNAAITGALLERQVEYLTSIRKEGISKVISHLLLETLGEYRVEKPVRRARVLLKSLEHMYHSGPSTMSAIGSPDEIGTKIEELLCDGNLSQDEGLVLQPVSLNSQTPPRQTESGKHMFAFEDFEKFDSLLRLSARICGIVSQILPKIHLLDMSRKLCEMQLGRQSDGYITSSVDLAHEYILLGKTRRAATIFDLTLDIVKSDKTSLEASAYFYLRYAESLALMEDASKSAVIYSEALHLSAVLDGEDRGLSTTERIRARVKRLEMAAIASHVFGLIKYLEEDVPATLDSMLKALRLWNRAADSLIRLSSPSSSSSASKDDNPFNMSDLKDALLSESSKEVAREMPTPKKAFPQRMSMDGFEWRISEGLMTTLFSLAEVYLFRGSAREAEYFAQQAQDLAESLNAPSLVSRALAKKGEIQLYRGHLDSSLEYLLAATDLLENLPGAESINVQRLRGLYNERMAREKDARVLYEKSLHMINELDLAFDNLVLSRKSIGVSSPTKNDVIFPSLLAALLRHHIWLLRNDDIQDYSKFLNTFISLSHSSQTKAEENVLMAKLALHNVYGRFRSDMFLSSLTESTIALPMGMSSKQTVISLPTAQEIISTLEAAEKFFWANLTRVAGTRKINDMREGLVSLALIQAFRTSLGRATCGTSNLAVGLLDASAAITLRREMVETIDHKFILRPNDDMKWPSITNSLPQPRPTAKGGRRLISRTSLHDDDDGEENSDANLDEGTLKAYWASVRARYQDQILDPPSLSSSQVSGLPSKWTVVNISVTEDKSTLFITRHECGSSTNAPLMFCIPLKDRRDSGDTEDEEQQLLTFDDAVNELKEIIRLSDERTKAAVNIKPEDREARATWWKERAELDTRLEKLLDNLEFRWLGAFKVHVPFCLLSLKTEITLQTILSRRTNLTADLIEDLRTQFERVFRSGLRVQDKKKKPRSGTHKKSASQNPNPIATEVTFDDTLLQCFSTLSPKCRDEELEDLVYFILDLYHFHGVQVAIAEVDIIQVVLDLRSVLEDHAQKLARQKVKMPEDEHLFLILDKNLQGLPWESIPILRGRSVSRIPSIDFLLDRVLFAEWKRKTLGLDDTFSSKGAIVDPRKGFYILNPSGDLGKTEARFKGWTVDMEKAGWEGIIGHAPSEQQFLNALRTQDLVVYFGHGGGEQYLRSHKIRNLPMCAATMLWGCSSGVLREMGDFDRVGTPYNYMLAGSPCLVANLWDVTDRDIDKFSQAVFDKIGLTADRMKEWDQSDRQHVSIVEAVGHSRDVCKLKYLTGAAPIVYGIPFYL
ncbi:hypothetical protein H0H92_012440 [Tricholoma furcatifolium]|nr:hypothetical protein H0H92_012440 [Tricholoma furcatifolium]